MSQNMRTARNFLATAKKPPDKQPAPCKPTKQQNKRKNSNPLDPDNPSVKSTKHSNPSPLDPDDSISPDCVMDTSQTSGVLSDDCQALPSAQPAQPSDTHPDQQRPLSARLDLDTLHQADALPADTRKVLLTSKSDSTMLSKINPYRVGKAMDALCGPLEHIEHMRTGGLLVTTKTMSQVEQLLKLTEISFYDHQTPVSATVAWSTQLSYGKIYAPELQGETLEYLLSILKPDKVVGVRKLLSDPTKVSVPLYVLTFLSPRPPQKLKIGYCQYNVDPYHPSPRRCGNCHRYGHSRAQCTTRKPVCSHCSQKDHTSDTCPAIAKEPVCLHCSGSHTATSRHCPAYATELRACRLRATENLSFADARERARLERVSTAPPSVAAPPPPAPTPPSAATLHSEAEYPSLTQLMEGYSTPVTPTPATTHFTPTPTHLPAVHLPSSSQPSPLPSSSLPPTPTYHPPASLYNFPGSQLPSARPSPRPTLAHTPTPLPPQSLHTASAPPHLSHLLLSLLPHFIRLLLAPQVTDKVECLVEIGRILSADAIVSSTLTQLGHSSLLHTQ